MAHTRQCKGFVVSKLTKGDTVFVGCLRWKDGVEEGKETLEAVVEEATVRSAGQVRVTLGAYLDAKIGPMVVDDGAGFTSTPPPELVCRTREEALAKLDSLLAEDEAYLQKMLKQVRAAREALGISTPFAYSADFVGHSPRMTLPQALSHLPSDMVLRSRLDGTEKTVAERLLEAREEEDATRRWWLHRTRERGASVCVEGIGFFFSEVWPPKGDA